MTFSRWLAIKYLAPLVSPTYESHVALVSIASLPRQLV